MEVSLCCVHLFPERGPCCSSGEKGDSGNTEEGGEGDCCGGSPITLLLTLLLQVHPSTVFPAFAHPETHFLHISATQRCPSNLPVPKPSYLRASRSLLPHQLPYSPSPLHQLLCWPNLTPHSSPRPTSCFSRPLKYTL